MSNTSNRLSFSVFGDSVSTLEGFQPQSYLVQYKGRFQQRSGVFGMGDTWWGMVLEHFGGRLLANDSYSGSTVTCLRADGRLYPCACSGERTGALAAAGKPDVLMVYLGTNDWDAQAPLYPESDQTPWWRTFEGAYSHMMADLKAQFAGTEFWCLNLTCSEHMLVEYPEDYLSTMPAYNDIIAEQAARAGARLVDLYSRAMGYPCPDLGHPSREGMRMIAQAVIDTMSEV